MATNVRHPKRYRRRKPQRSWRLAWIVSLVLVWLLCSGDAWANSLSSRVTHFPMWDTRPPVQPAQGDLYYPQWLAGSWDVTTTLVDMVAPAAPEVVSPGFESNRQFLDRPVRFQARFLPEAARSLQLPWFMVPLSTQPRIVADRAFNGLNLARASLEAVSQGEATLPRSGKTQSIVQAVKVDPDNPNRQITLLRGDRQLVSTVTARATETPSAHEFVTTEVFQQEFRGQPQIYFNIVETTTAYQYQPRLTEPVADHGESPEIVADQVTAVYLSPQDPDFFKLGDRPVALYRYQLAFHRSALATGG
ncbi:DUF6816 family protein [Leptolyngbya sp. AN02str]|uniref:DUF6816 family protein n=1 Tax=Leptolyngbya sp. AN02str TaxID=3423363 RepID=UPI003D31BD61